jgi:hypothetical protein
MDELIRAMHKVLLAAAAAFIIWLIFRSYAEPPMGEFESELLNIVNARCASLIKYIRTQPGLLDDRRVQILLMRFRAGQIRPMRPGKGAGFTVDKGREIRLCVPSDGDVMTAMFVALHELAHVVTEQNGHTPMFWANFAFLLDLAVKAGVYVPQRFSKEKPGNYCGQSITYQPLSNMGRRPTTDASRLRGSRY